MIIAGIIKKNVGRTFYAVCEQQRRFSLVTDHHSESRYFVSLQ